MVPQQTLLTPPEALRQQLAGVPLVCEEPSPVGSYESDESARQWEPTPAEAPGQE